jgi:hypothetical protein
VGVAGIMQQILEGAPLFSRIVGVGVCMQSDKIEPALAINKELEIQYVLGYTPLEFRDTLHMIAEGKIDVSPLITGVVGLEGVGNLMSLFSGGMLGFTLRLSILATSFIFISLPISEPCLGGGAAGLLVTSIVVVVFPPSFAGVLLPPAAFEVSVTTSVFIVSLGFAGCCLLAHYCWHYSGDLSGCFLRQSS